MNVFAVLKLAAGSIFFAIILYLMLCLPGLLSASSSVITLN
jgi:hypothetical protein